MVHSVDESSKRIPPHALLLLRFCIFKIRRNLIPVVPLRDIGKYLFSNFDLKFRVDEDPSERSFL